jgi:signal transduction histidine kinase
MLRRPVAEVRFALSNVGMALAGPRPESEVARFPDVRVSHRFGRYALMVAALAVAYWGIAKLSYVLGFAGPVAAIAWLPVGIGVAFLAVFGLGFWPGALIGDLLANHELALPLAGALGQTCGNMLEVLLAAALIRRWLGRDQRLSRLGDMGWLLVALALGTLVSALVGPLSLLLAGTVSQASLWSVMRTWWLGDFCGALVIVPMVLVWRPLPRRFLRGRRLLEAGLLLAAVAAVSAVGASTSEAITYLVFPLLAVVVLLLGLRGGTLAVLVAVTATILTATQVHGAFASYSFMHSVLSTQLFIGVLALSMLLLGVMVSEQHVLENRLDVSRARAIHAADAERTRIERDLHDGAQQRLLALAIRLGLAADRRLSPESAATVITEAWQELENAIDELRELSHGTHPAVLSELGLAGAVSGVAARSTIPVTVVSVPRLRLDATAEVAAYYLIVEGIVNAQKHAHAREIRIDVGYSAPVLHVAVSDNGRGGADERGGSGLAGLRRRIEELDGEFSLRSSSAGTTLAADIPALPA